MSRVPRKEHLVETALELFNRDGFHATGIDKILARAGVAKMTLYKHFASKDELILAALQLREERFFDNLQQRAQQLQAEHYNGEPAGALWALFDTVGEWMRGDDFCGCTFINASAEFGELSDPAHRLAAEHKLRLRDVITKQLQPLNKQQPQRLAQQLLLLLDGAIVHAQTTGNRDAIDDARAAAEQLVAIAP